MKNRNREILSEAKRDLDLAVVKALSNARLSRAELDELLAVTQSTLILDHECDLYMAEKVKQHAKEEQFRMRSQNSYTPAEETGGLYPSKPYTRTSPLREDAAGGRMLDYGNVVSDSHEGKMAKGSLRNIAVDSYRLYQLLDDGDDLPQWCEYKIAQAQLMMNSVREYLEYKLEDLGLDLPGELEIFADDSAAEGLDV